MVRVGIVGATGYTGAELLRILVHHPEVEISVLTSETHVGRSYEEVYPALRGLLGGTCEPLDTDRVAERCDLVFAALPHTKSMACIPQFLERVRLVVDLSADFRLTDPAVYEAWYAPHTAPDLLREAVYGLPELYREAIRKARLVANPGCYPTSAILGVAPLLRQGWVAPESLIVNAASGVTGAGRSLNLGSLFCEVNEGMKPYKVGEHRHTPEMEQEMSLLVGAPVRITFIPHLVPLSRGILSTLYGRLDAERDEAQILEAYKAFYKDEPFVRVLPRGAMPDIRDVRGTNLCDIGIKVDTRTDRVIVVVAIDNLVKGGAGQAVQNMNLALGFTETQGLEQPSLFL